MSDMPDEKTSVLELKKKVAAFCTDMQWNNEHHNAKDLAIQISTEAAELLEHFRFEKEANIQSLMRPGAKRHEIEEELADVLYGVLRIAQLYDIDLSETLEKKLGKIKKKYSTNK